MSLAEHENDETQTEEVAVDESEQQQGEQPEGESGAGPASDEGVDVVIEGVSPTPEEEEEQRAPQWVRDLRKKTLELTRENRELKAQAQAINRPKVVEVGPEPELEDFEYDQDKFKAAYRDWTGRKTQADADAQRQKDEQANAQKAWQATLDNHGAQKAGLKVRDYDDAESIVRDVLNVTQQGIILNGADNSAVLVYALGKNPKKAKELASIADPVKFAFAVAKLETQLKVMPRKTAPLPETAVRGSAAGLATSDARLKELEAEADRTGNRTKVVAYRKQLKAAGKK